MSTGRVCSMDGCAFGAALWVARLLPPSGAANATFTAKPLSSMAPQGVPLCVDHAHEALDYMIAASVLPAAAEADKPERTG